MHLWSEWKNHSFAHKDWFEQGKVISILFVRHATLTNLFLEQINIGKIKILRRSVRYTSNGRRLHLCPVCNGNLKTIDFYRKSFLDANLMLSEGFPLWCGSTIRLYSWIGIIAAACSCAFACLDLVCLLLTVSTTQKYYS